VVFLGAVVFRSIDGGVPHPIAAFPTEAEAKAFLMPKSYFEFIGWMKQAREIQIEFWVERREVSVEPSARLEKKEAE